MKTQQTYSLNVEVVKAFNEFVPMQTRSGVIEALMIKYLIAENDTQGGLTPELIANDSNLSQKEIT